MRWPHDLYPIHVCCKMRTITNHIKPKSGSRSHGYIVYLRTVFARRKYNLQFVCSIHGRNCFFSRGLAGKETSFRWKIRKALGLLPSGGGMSPLSVLYIWRKYSADNPASGKVNANRYNTIQIDCKGQYQGQLVKLSCWPSQTTRRYPTKTAFQANRTKLIFKYRYTPNVIKNAGFGRHTS